MEEADVGRVWRVGMLRWTQEWSHSASWILFGLNAGLGLQGARRAGGKHLIRVALVDVLLTIFVAGVGRRTGDLASNRLALRIVC